MSNTECKCGNEKAWDSKSCPECQNNNNRRNYIGGSEIAAVMGQSRWKTPLQVWAEKTGEVPPEDISDKEHVQLGTELEDFVAKKFERVTGMKVRKAPKRYIHPDYPFMRCQVDRLITGTDYLLEVKTCSAWKEKEWEGEEIPIEYILQVTWQLMVTGRKVGYIAVLIGGQKFRWKKIEADYKLMATLKQGTIDFWEMVQDKTPPMAMAQDNDFMVKLYPEAEDKLLEASQDVNDAIGALQLIKAEQISLAKKRKEIEAKIKAIIGEACGLETEEYLAKWTPTKATTYTVNKKAGRMLRIKKKGA